MVYNLLGPFRAKPAVASLVIDFGKYILLFGGNSSNSTDFKKKPKQKNQKPPEISAHRCKGELSVVWVHGKERELIVMCLHSLLHLPVAQRNTGLLAQDSETWLLPWLHRAEQCQWDFGFILAAVFMGQGWGAQGRWCWREFGWSPEVF